MCDTDCEDLREEDVRHEAKRKVSVCVCVCLLKGGRRNNYQTSEIFQDYVFADN